MEVVLRVLTVFYVVHITFVWSTTTTPPGNTDSSFLMIHMTNLELSLASVQTQLQVTQEEQKSTSDELVSMKAELRLAQDKVIQVEFELKQVRVEHNSSLKEQSSTLDELSSVKAELRLNEDSLHDVKTQMRDLEIEHAATVNELNSLKDTFGATHDKQVTLQTEFDMLKSDTRTAESELAVVKHQAGVHETEIGKLSAEVNQIKTNVAEENHSSHPAIDKTLLDSMHADVQTSVAEMNSLKSRLDSANQDINVTSTRVQTLQLLLHSFQTNVSVELKNLESQLTSSSLLNPSFSNQTGSTFKDVQELRDRLGSVEEKLHNTTHDLNSIGSELNTFFHNESPCTGNQTANIGFEIRLHMDSMTVHMGDKLAFDIAQYNNGGAYDESSGIFTAPVTGSYFFWAQIMMAQAESMLELYLQRNGLVIGKSFVETPTDTVYGILSYTSVTYLNKGDLVWFQKGKGTNNIYGKLYSGYGGVLVSKN